MICNIRNIYNNYNAISFQYFANICFFFNGLKNNALITNISAPFKKEEEEEEEEEALFGVEVPNPFEYYDIFHDEDRSHNVSHHVTMGHKIIMRIDLWQS